MPTKTIADLDPAGLELFAHYLIGRIIGLELTNNVPKKELSTTETLVKEWLEIDYDPRKW